MKSIPTNRETQQRLLKPANGKSHFNTKRLILGVANNDMAGTSWKEGGKIKQHKAYKTWSNHVSLTYCPKRRETTGTKTLCSDMAPEWLSFSGYYKWWLDQPYYAEGATDSDFLAAAKDLPKAYTPETATIVPRQLNNILGDTAAFRGDMPQGIVKHKGRYTAVHKTVGKKTNVGTSTDLVTASNAYWEAKLVYTLVRSWELLEGHPQRDDLMLGIKKVLQQQHEAALIRINSLLPRNLTLDKGTRHVVACDNTSGVNGVTWQKVSNKWRAGATVAGACHYLGLHETIFEAAAARIRFDNARLEDSKSSDSLEDRDYFRTAA